MECLDLEVQWLGGRRGAEPHRAPCRLRRGDAARQGRQTRHRHEVHAVVVFRADATAVISSQANEATPHRAVALAGSFLASGALVVVVAAFWPKRRVRLVPDTVDPFGLPLVPLRMRR